MSPILKRSEFEPKLITVFKEGYSVRRLLADLSAGVTVGIIALPLAIAFAIASGVKPEQGLYTAIVAGFVIALFGGSRVQVSGPTGAFVVVVYSIVQEHGYNGLAVATLIAGVLLIGMGLSGLGTLLKFVPYPVTIGFTSGIALVIFSLQLPDFFGFQIGRSSSSFVDRWSQYWLHLGESSPSSCIIGFSSLAIVILWPRITHRIPGSLVAIVAATAAVQLLKLPVETIGSRFGTVPNTLPAPHLPDISWELVREMFSPAVTIALLGAIESLLSAVVADGMLGTRHRSNMELVAQGIGNIASPLFLGIPATGAIARTAANVKNGGRTPVAAVIHAGTLLLIMLFLGQFAALVPMSCLAAILISLAYHMSDWRTFLRILKTPRSDVAVLLTTFFLTVLIDLTVAIEVGMVLAAFLFLRRMEEAVEVGNITQELREMEEQREDARPFLQGQELPPGVEVFEVYGPLFFGAVERFRRALERIEEKPKVLILLMRHVPVIDASGIHALENLHEQTQKAGTLLLLAGLRHRPFRALRKSDFISVLGRTRIYRNIEGAVRGAQRYLSES